MIYTITLNPSIDYVVRAQSIQLGALNRMTHDLKLPGGKGINVSRILKRIGVDSTALGFLGGFTGAFIEDWLKKEQISTRFTPIQADTRINIKLKAELETEINGLGPDIHEVEIQQLKQALDLLSKEDIVILSGSTPGTLREGVYKELIHLIKAKGANFVIDTTGQDLANALPQQPLLIKPNNLELAELFSDFFSFHCRYSSLWTKITNPRRSTCNYFYGRSWRFVIYYRRNLPRQSLTTTFKKFSRCWRFYDCWLYWQFFSKTGSTCCF
jgi:1-phosphofructokinase